MRRDLRRKTLMNHWGLWNLVRNCLSESRLTQSLAWSPWSIKSPMTHQVREESFSLSICWCILRGTKKFLPLSFSYSLFKCSLRINVLSLIWVSFLMMLTCSFRGRFKLPSFRYILNLSSSIFIQHAVSLFRINILFILKMCGKYPLWVDFAYFNSVTASIYLNGSLYSLLLGFPTSVI